MKLQPELHAALLDNAANLSIWNAKPYVNKRISSAPDHDMDVMLERAPDDIRALCNMNPSPIGYAELDLIDFLLRYKNNRVLAVLGMVGTGKTTYLYHVFKTVRLACDSLKRFIPLIININATGTEAPSYEDLSLQLVTQMHEALADHMVVAAAQADALDRLHSDLARTDFLSGKHFTNTSFVDLVIRMRAALPKELEIVVVFDNLDHISPDSVVKIADLGRAVHLNTNCFVIMAMRPAVYQTQRERRHTKGAFPYFAIRLEPPDLREIIRMRMIEVIQNAGRLEIQDEQGRLFVLQNPFQSAMVMTRRLLSSDNQRDMMLDLYDRNIRRSLMAFEYFCRYRSLDYALFFDVAQDEQSGIHKGSWRAHLLDGLMIGHYDHYADGRGTDITNLFVFEGGGETDYLLLYYTLALLGWKAEHLNKTEAVDWLVAFGFRKAAASTALTHLLNRHLIFCVDSEGDLASGHWLRISESGSYYLNKLMDDASYLANAVYDIPLQHAQWREDAPDSFAAKLGSVNELLNAVHLAEEKAIAALLKVRRNWPLLGAILQSGLLTRRTLKMAQGLVNRSLRSSVESARLAATEYQRLFVRVEADCSVAEERMRTILADEKLISHDQSIRTLRFESGEFEILLEVPHIISEAESNRVQVLVQGKDEHGAVPDSVYWRSLADFDHSDRLARLEPKGGRRFEAEFNLAGVKGCADFPSSCLTLFASSEPLVVANIPS